MCNANRKGNTPLNIAVNAGAAHNIALLVPQVDRSIKESHDSDEDKDSEDDDVEEVANDNDDEEEGNFRTKQKARQRETSNTKIAAKVNPVLSNIIGPSAQSNINQKDIKTGMTIFHAASPSKLD